MIHGINSWKNSVKICDEYPSETVDEWKQGPVGWKQAAMIERE